MKKSILFLLLSVIGLTLSTTVFAQKSSPVSRLQEKEETSPEFTTKERTADRKSEQPIPDDKKIETDKERTADRKSEQPIPDDKKIETDLWEEGIKIVPEEEILRFGERFFMLPLSTFTPITEVPVSPDYVLGPGDELIIEVWGMVDMREQVTIDNDGGIFLPQIGRIYLAGIPFQRAENLIKQQFGKYYTNFELVVTISRLRSIKVFVLGEAKNPGAYELSSLSTLFHALYLSRGPSSIGSMRNIKLIRDGEIVGTVDTYQFLLYGDKSHDYRLQSGDTVFIPLAGPMVTIEGEIRRPAIYELNGEKNLLDVINLAGGAKSSAYGGRIQIRRIDRHDKKSIIDLKDVSEIFGGYDTEKNIKLHDGDIVRIFPVDPRIYNKIFLEGFVKYPGKYQWKSGLALSDILTPEALHPEAYLQRAEIERIDFPSMETKIFFFSPEKLFKGEESENIFLQPLDRIKILSEWKEPATVVLKGEVKLPGEYTIEQGERLSSVLKRAGSFTDEAFLQGAVFTRESVRAVQREHIDRLIRTQEEMLLRAVGIAETDKDSERAQLLVEQRRLISLLASYIPLGRVPINLKKLDEFKDSPDDLILEGGDTLSISKPPMVVNIVGAVNNPGAVLWTKDRNIDYYLDMCGGLTRNADTRNIFVIRADGTAVAQEYQVRGRSASRIIYQGDTIIVPEEIKIVGWRQIAKDVATIFYNIALPVSFFLR